MTSACPVALGRHGDHAEPFAAGVDGAQAGAAARAPRRKYSGSPSAIWGASRLRSAETTSGSGSAVMKAMRMSPAPRAQDGMSR